MRQVFDFIKENLPVILPTIFIYQVFLSIFFYSVNNFRILSLMTFLCAIYIIIDKYKSKWKKF